MRKRWWPIKWRNRYWTPIKPCRTCQLNHYWGYLIQRVLLTPAFNWFISYERTKVPNDISVVVTGTGHRRQSSKTEGQWVNRLNHSAIPNLGPDHHRRLSNRKKRVRRDFITSPRVNWLPHLDGCRRRMPLSAVLLPEELCGWTRAKARAALSRTTTANPETASIHFITRSPNDTLCIHTNSSVIPIISHKIPTPPPSEPPKKVQKCK